jgi:hypothetical protein
MLKRRQFICFHQPQIDRLSTVVIGYSFRDLASSYFFEIHKFTFPLLFSCPSGSNDSVFLFSVRHCLGPQFLNYVAEDPVRLWSWFAMVCSTTCWIGPGSSTIADSIVLFSWFTLFCPPTSWLGPGFFFDGFLVFNVFRNRIRRVMIVWFAHLAR